LILSTSKKILIAPLDWGLGHATRSIPIINEFLYRGCEVQLASSGSALILLRQEYPKLKLHELVSYDVHYSKIIPLTLSLFFQIPKFLKRIREEHDQIERIVRDEKIDLMISDSRFGCWAEHIPSAFITHQINLQLPWTIRWLSPFVSYFNRQQIKKFKYCWVPDEPTDRISGKLSEANGLNVRYMGMLSRFEKDKLVEIKYDLLVLLSGPEPQRTLLEQKLLTKLQGTLLNVLFVRGMPGYSIEMKQTPNMIYKNHLNAKELNQVIQESKIVLSRSGYSTVMDLAKLGKKAIFIPTPGQTEQLYLARQLRKRKIAYCTNVDNLDIAAAIKFSSDYTGFKGEYKNDLLSVAINEVLV